MARGDHIRARRAGYWHHGIDCGDGTVIHYTGTPFRMRYAVIERCTLEQFLLGREAEVVVHANRLEPEAIIKRAESRLGECRYDLVRCNCEHFASWCAAGQECSQQVTKVVKAVVAGGVLVTVSAAAIVANEILRRREVSEA